VENVLSEALAHLDAGRLDAAQSLARSVLARRPKDVIALQCMGLAALRGGCPDEAVPWLRQAAKLQRGDAGLLTNLGVALKAAGRLDEAVQAFTLATRAAPGAGEIHFNLGNALQALRRDEAAEAAYRRALAAGNCRQGGAAVHANLGLLLEARGAGPDAVGAHRAAVRLRPDVAEYHYNLGNALRAVLALDDAIAAYDRALALRADYHEARLNQSLALLLKGDFARGFAGYEARLETAEVERRDFPTPPWRGEPLDGRRLLVFAEQGLGDAIQFLRYLPALSAGGQRIIVEVQPALRRLVDAKLAREALTSVTVVSRGEQLPGFDVHASLMSLPATLGFDAAAIPGQVPYLWAKPDAVARWRARVAADAALAVGLVWAGNPHHRNDRNRSIAPAAMAPLIRAISSRHGDARFFSLQVGPAGADLSAFPPGSVIDLAPSLDDFAETAAALTALDVLICVDTSVAHLAAALGRPVELLLPYHPDWRWLLDRPDSPWYPTITLHRQTVAGDWSAPLAALAAAFDERGRCAWSASPTRAVSA
jgi:tetratricopeptide (TPR) repeat protein